MVYQPRALIATLQRFRMLFQHPYKLQPNIEDLPKGQAVLDALGEVLPEVWASIKDKAFEMAFFR